jgi:hypothetical protein
MARPEAWQGFLEAQGAHWEDEAVAHFGDPGGDLRAAADGTILADLGERAFLAATGTEVVPFLQGQLTADVTPLEAGAPVWGAHLTPKGRVLGAPFIFPLNEGEGFGLDLPADLAEALTRKLRMYVLMADVRLEEAGGSRVRLGLAGPGAAGAAAAAIGLPEVDGGAVTAGERGRAVPLPGPAPAFLVVVPPDSAAAAWQAAAEHARPVGRAPWTLARIRAGVPDPGAPVSEAFIPQELNLEPLGAISYTKGCYTGQEVVARTKHLGRLKRRLYRAAAPEVPAAGAAVHAPEDDQARGRIVGAAPSPDGGGEVLAVLRIDTADAGSVLTAEGGSGPLDLRELPYPAPEAMD